MDKEKKQIEKTAAETKSIGFDYQYYFFLWKLLSLETGGSVGLEVKDDVHTELNNSKQIFYQIKHTIQKKSDGTSTNLSTLDKDFWKTLSNWAKVISDKNDGRGKKNQQLIFLKKTSFVLASNKSSASNNKILKSIADLQIDQKSITKIKTVFKDLSDKTQNNNIIRYIEDILELQDDVLNSFLLHVFFELDEDDIIQKCKDAIKSDKIPENRIDDVFSSLDSSIRADNFIDIKNGKKIEIAFDDFYLKYRRHYDLARSASLKIKAFTGKLPDRLEEQTFIKQILEIKDVQSDDIEAIAEYTRFRLKLRNNVDEWLQNGELTNEEIESLRNDAINQWKNEFRKGYRGDVDIKEYNSKGLGILDCIRDKKLKIADQELETDMCNGEFYELSDTPEIGWRKDWERYKK